MSFLGMRLTFHKLFFASCLKKTGYIEFVFLRRTFSGLFLLVIEMRQKVNTFFKLHLFDKREN